MSKGIRKESAKYKILMVLLVVLLVIAVGLVVLGSMGLIQRNTDAGEKRLNTMRDAALHSIAYDECIDDIIEAAEEAKATAEEAKATAEEAKATAEEAKDAVQEAIAEYEKAWADNLYNIHAAADALEKAYIEKEERVAEEKRIYAEIYTKLYQSVSDWTDFVGEKEDDALYAEIIAMAESLEDNSYLKEGILKFVRNRARVEKNIEDKTLYNQLYASLVSKIGAGEQLNELSDDELYEQLLSLESTLAEREDFRESILSDIRIHIELSKDGVVRQIFDVEPLYVKENVEVDYAYYQESDKLIALVNAVIEKRELLFGEISKVYPMIAEADEDALEAVYAKLDNLGQAKTFGYTDRYEVYASCNALFRLSAADTFNLNITVHAYTELFAGIAILLAVFIVVMRKKIFGLFSIRKAVKALFVLTAVVLIVAACVGFILRTTDYALDLLNDMRDKAVLHVASDGFIDSIAAEAKGNKQKELRKDPDFRKMGQNEVNAKLAEAENEARAEATALYGGAGNADAAGIRTVVVPFASAYSAANERIAYERNTYLEIGDLLIEKVTDWTEFADEKDDASLLKDIKAIVKELEGNEYLETDIVAFVREMANSEREEEKERDERAEQIKMIDEQVNHKVADMIEKDSAESFSEVIGKMMETLDVEPSDYTSAIVESYKNYEYYSQSEAIKILQDIADEEYNKVFSELCVLLPDLSDLSKKLQNGIRDEIVTIVAAGDSGFAEQYDTYIAKGVERIRLGDSILWFAVYAKIILIAGIAVLLIALVSIYWKQLTKRFGVPRTIISLFFIFLCLAAELYNIYMPLMFSNILVRIGMYGILALAMLPGIQCGIGLNMGMTLGCISGLLSTIIALQLNMDGFDALIFSCVGGALIAIPLGWAYSLLLNRMKGSEMTISTYVGFSFVSLMCIGWVLLPFTNPKIIWLLSGKGLRVTHSLLDSFANILDNLLKFEIFGVTIPTGLLLFFLACCACMWLFSHSKLGVAMTAAGNNPRFAEASGINVNRMRTLGTVLSTVIAAIGIVIYSQAFGYAQLYTAPRQMGFIAASIILIGGATVSRAKVNHVIIGVFLFEGVLALGQQIANAAVAGGGLSEVMRILISNGIILYALTQSGGGSRE